MALDAFVAPNATLVGDVLMLTQSSVWYGAVLRGDRNKITVGAFSNIQDKVVIDCTSELETGFPAEVDILNHVTVGHGAVLRSCVIKDRCIVGMNAVISEGCVMERTSMVAAGSVLLPHTVVPSGQLWAGNPAVYIRDLKFEEIESFEKVMLHPLSLSHSLTHSRHDRISPYSTLQIRSAHTTVGRGREAVPGAVPAERGADPPGQGVGGREYDSNRQCLHHEAVRGRLAVTAVHRKGV